MKKPTTIFAKNVYKVLEENTNMEFITKNINEYYSILVEKCDEKRYTGLYLELFAYYRDADNSLSNLSFFKLLDDKWKNLIREIYS